MKRSGEVGRDSKGLEEVGWGWKRSVTVERRRGQCSWQEGSHPQNAVFMKLMQQVSEEEVSRIGHRLIGKNLWRTTLASVCLHAWKRVHVCK